MPLIRVTSLPTQQHLDVSATLSRACQAVAKVLELPTNQVWATWVALEPDCYVQGDVAAGVQPSASHPPLVELMTRASHGEEKLASACKAAAEVIAEGFELEPGNVFAYYTELSPERTFYK